MTTTYDLAALDAAHAKATGGEWWDESGVIHAPGPNWTEENHSCIHPATVKEAEDAACIVLLHNAWPAVSAEVKRLRRVEEAARALSRNWNYGAPFSIKTMEEIDAALKEAPNA